MKTFRNDDEGYKNWLTRNPSGFVVNSFKKPVPEYLFLHKASCRTINYATRGPGNWTTTGFIKICSLNQSELEMWAKNEVGGKLHHCQICKP